MLLLDCIAKIWIVLTKRVDVPLAIFACPSLLSHLSPSHP